MKMNILEYVTNLDSSIYHQGDMIAGDEFGNLENRLYFVLKGKVEVQRILDSDHSLRTYFLLPGGFFGFAPLSREARIREQYLSLEVNTKIGFLESKQIERIGKASPQFFFALLKHSIEKLIEVEEEIKETTNRIQSKQAGL
jgi:CRP-like cAMP-binding protein